MAGRRAMPCWSSRLSSRDRERLRAALAAVAPIDDLMRDLLFKD